MLLAVLAHVDAHHRPLVVEQEVGQRLGELGLADTGGPEEQERTGRPVGVGDPARGDERRRRPPHRLAVCPTTRLPSSAPSAAAWRSRPPAAARPGCRSTPNDVGDVVGPDFLLEHHVPAGRRPCGNVASSSSRLRDAPVAQLGGLGQSPSRSASSDSPRSESSCSLSSRTTSMALFSFFHRVSSASSPSGRPVRAQLLQPILGRRVLFLGQRHLLDLEPTTSRLPRRPRRAANRSPSSAHGGLVDQVDRLVRQEAGSDVAVGQRRRGHQRGVGDAHTVVHLVASFRPRRMPTVSSTEARRRTPAGSAAPARRPFRCTCGTRRASWRRPAAARPGEHRLDHVAGVHRASPDAPAPTMVCSSSMNVMISPAEFLISSSTALSRSSNSPRYLAPRPSNPGRTR